MFITIGNQGLSNNGIEKKVGYLCGIEKRSNYTRFIEIFNRMMETSQEKAFDYLRRTTLITQAEKDYLIKTR